MPHNPARLNPILGKHYNEECSEWICSFASLAGHEAQLFYVEDQGQLLFFANRYCLTKIITAYGKYQDLIPVFRCVLNKLCPNRRANEVNDLKS